jgi:hypothetical protein
MAITKDVNGYIVETPVKDKDQFDRTGVIHDDSFAICDEVDRLKQFKVDVSDLGTRSNITLKAPTTSPDTNIILTLPATSGPIGGGDSFTIIQPDSGTSPTASGSSTLSLLGSTDSKIVTVGDSTTDTIRVKLSGFTQGYVPFGNSSGSLDVDSSAYWDNTNKMLSLGYGFSPSARLHSLGQQVSTSAPTSFSGSYTAELSNTLGTASAAVTYGPEISDNMVSLGATQSSGSGSYFSDGTTSITYTVYAVRVFEGNYYYRGSPVSTSFTDNNDSMNFVVDLSWTSVTNCDGYLIVASGSAGTGNPNFGYYLAGAGNSSFQDTGANSSSDSPSFWDSYCYPYYSGGTAPTPLSGSITPTRTNVGSGNFISLNLDYIFEVDTAVQIAGTWYASGTPLSSTSTNDGNDALGFDWYCSGWSNSGVETDLIVRRSTDGGMSWTYFFVALGSDFTDTNYSNDSTAQTAWNNVYGGPPATLTHYYRQYGYRTSPTNSTPYYSTTNNSYSVVANNDTNGYIIKHTLTHGSGGQSKLIGSHDVPFDAFNGGHLTSASSVIEYYYGTFTDTITVTPTHYGFQATGQTKYFRFYAQKSSPITYYSSSYLSGSVTLPNDGNYYTVDVSFTKGTGSVNTRVLRSNDGSTFSEGYLFGGTSFVMEQNTPSFTSGTTVTPNTVDGPAGIFENTTSNIIGSMQITAKTQTASTGIAGIQLHSSTDTRLAAFYANTSDGISNIFSNGTGLKLHNNSAGNYADLLLTECLFNKTYNGSYNFKVYSSGISYGFRLIPSTNQMRMLLGDIANDYGNTLQILNPSNSQASIHLRSTTTGLDLVNAILIDNAGTNVAGISRTGRMYLNLTNPDSDAYLTIGGSSSSTPLRIKSQSYTPTTDGDIWHDSTYKMFNYFMAGIRHFMPARLFTSTASATVANTTSETSVVGSGVGSNVLPNNFLTVGKSLKIRAWGRLSSVSSATITMKVKFGSTVLCSTAAHTTHNITNDSWYLESMITCRTAGSSGTVWANGRFYDTSDLIQMGNTATITVNTTTTQTVTVSAQWNTASASNTISCDQFLIEVM